MEEGSLPALVDKAGLMAIGEDGSLTKLDSVSMDDVKSILSIDVEHLSEELSRQPGIAFYCAMRAADRRSQLAVFEEIVFGRFQGHCRKYARLYLDKIGEKPTLQALKDKSLEMFSGSTGGSERRAYVTACFLQDMIEKHGSVEKAMSFKAEDENSWVARRKEFMEDMYGHSCLVFRGKCRSYEDFILQHSLFKRDAEVSAAIAKAYEQRGFALTSIAYSLRSAGDPDGSRVREEA